MHHRDRNIHVQGFQCREISKRQKDAIDGLRIMWVAGKITLAVWLVLFIIKHVM